MIPLKCVTLHWSRIATFQDQWIAKLSMNPCAKPGIMSIASWMTFRIAEQSKSTNAKSSPKGTPLRKNAMNGRFKNVVSNLNWLRKSHRKLHAIKCPKSCALQLVADSFRVRKSAIQKRKRRFMR